MFCDKQFSPRDRFPACSSPATPRNNCHRRFFSSVRDLESSEIETKRWSPEVLERWTHQLAHWKIEPGHCAGPGSFRSHLTRKKGKRNGEKSRDLRLTKHREHLQQ